MSDYITCHECGERLYLKHDHIYDKFYRELTNCVAEVCVKCADTCEFCGKPSLTGINHIDCEIEYIKDALAEGGWSLAYNTELAQRLAVLNAQLAEQNRAAAQGRI